MISHKHKCIFIHISKCAGTSVEHAFGVDTKNHKAEENDFLFGWDTKMKIWLQHATPQQLIDLNLITANQWNSYYKFVIYRNSWDRAYSDYKWMWKIRGIKDSFKNYINRSGAYTAILNNSWSGYYAGDHLNSQKDYFFLNGTRIEYNQEINFENLEEGFEKIIQDLSLPDLFFDLKLNTTLKKKEHYSKFYNSKRKKLVEQIFREDIKFFGFKFDDKKTIFEKWTKEFQE